MIRLSYMKIFDSFVSLFSKPVSKQISEPVTKFKFATINKSLSLRHVDAGSCNGCEIEIASAFGPIYDASRFGTTLVASPRHADGLLVTGVVTENMLEPLNKAYEATPNPKIVIACGDCAVNGNIFRDGYGVKGTVGDFLNVDVSIKGCPPHPTDIVETLRGIVDTK